ncbi:aryl-sulfate sulfotransferase [candidate division KSB1 bacterium]|nr:aryl-sulfate sulfotransferase [candidate division KSB1 bacterium]
MINRKITYLILLIFCLNPALGDSGAEGENQHSTLLHRAGDPVVLNGVSVPSDFPFVNVTVNNSPDTGYVFINTSWGSNPHYSMILDNTGAPVWYVRSDDNRQDLKVQLDGRITHMIDPGWTDRYFVALDTTYTVVDTFIVPEGYFADEHDLQVLPNGHYLIIAKRDSLIDMSQIVPGGNPTAWVLGNTLVEMDENDNPVFMWHSWDHFNIEDAIHEDLTGGSIDYVHMNAMDVDLDGHYLISSRHLSEITKINRHTGEIIWRLGGQNDDFTWTNDAHRISYQHDIRVLPNGNYTVMDNGNNRHPHFSRALEFSVDTINWTVTKVWEYPEAHNIATGWMGNVQRLPNGNTLINWADNSLPKLTEVRSDGVKVFELDFVQSHSSYRTFRFPWKGNAAIPYLIIEPHPEGATLLMNKFGDPDVTEYRIYGGTAPHPDEIIASTSQPFIHLSSELHNKAHNHLRVTAVDSHGNESGFSNEDEIFINQIVPGDNMVANGDFSDGFNLWEWEVAEGQASWEINNQEELHVQIEVGGSETWHIQARQPNIQLIQGKTYKFEFDAFAAAGRSVEFEVRKDGDPWTNYSQRGFTWLTQVPQHYTHEFVMEYASESQARIVLNTGSSNHDVYIDNISLKEVVAGIPEEKSGILAEFKLHPNYPNPFNPETVIRYTLGEKSKVQISVYNMLGREVKSWNEINSAGGQEIRFNANDLPSGIYFYRLEAHATNSDRSYQQTRKMLLLK